MKRLTTFLALSAAALLSGCGASRPVSTPPPPETPPIPNVAGNWQFNATSTVPGNPPIAVAGSIGQSGSSISGALHVEGSSCFDQLTVMGLNGTVSADGTSLTSTLTSTSLDGQVVTFTGDFHFLTNTFTGTYVVNGGCANGDKGSVTGSRISLTDADGWSGEFTSSSQTSFGATGNFAQSVAASSEGSFGVTGTASLDSPCFGAATLSTGIFPSGSFVLGSQVSLEILTDNGTLTFTGTESTGEVINGTYKIVGGTCDQTGTAVVTLVGQWDY